MSSSNKTSNAGIPAWQRASPVKEPSETPAESPTLEQARKFLQDEAVQRYPQEKKAEFLSQKGLAADDVKKLLGEIGTSPEPQDKEPKPDRGAHVQQATVRTQALPNATHLVERAGDRPPIVTYPEFLVKPTKRPPLVTLNRFVNTLYAFGGVVTLFYGTSKFVVEPMVESLTDARIEFHEATSRNLVQLVEKLEDAVFEIPLVTRLGPQMHEERDNDDSSYEDPTELFHRDMGVQTSLPCSPGEAWETRKSLQDAGAQQAQRIGELTASLREIKGGMVSLSEDSASLKADMDSLSQDLDNLIYGPGLCRSTYFIPGCSSMNEPNDAIKKAKGEIRKIKGSLVSIQNFRTLGR